MCTRYSVAPDQTAPSDTAWSGSTLFAQTYLSKYLRSLQNSKTAI